jgi:hypothetical protein
VLPTRFRPLVLLLAATLLPACYSWRTSTVPVDQALTNRPDEVRVTRHDGTQLILSSPHLSGDTLIGVRRASRSEVSVAVPLSDVRAIEVRRFDGVETAGLIVGVGATAILIAAAVGGSDNGGAVDDGGSGGGSGSGGDYYSCPLVYSWDGTRWRLDSGTFGGAIARALARTDVDNLAYAVAQRDTLRLRIANELRETDHVDELAVLAVDHEPGVTVAPTPDGRLRVIGPLQAPIAALDSRGRDALPQVRALDDRVWESALVPRDTARVDDIRDALDLTFPRPTGDSTDLVLDARNTVWAAYLVGEVVRAHGREVDAWYASLEADSARAAGLRRKLASEAFLSVSVLTDRGWENQALVWEAGPEIAKRQVVTLSLTGVRDTLLRVRLEAPAAFWSIDQVGIGSASQAPRTVREARLDAAGLADGLDAADLLRQRDGRTLTLEPGESAEVLLTVPPIEAGMSRSYMLRTHGWYRLHAGGDGEPDAELLAAVFDRPAGVARMAAVRMNGALERLEWAR